MMTVFIVCKVQVARLLGKKVVFILATPIHQNIGDLAIAYAEKNFVGSYAPNTVAVSVPLPIVAQNNSWILGQVRDGDVLTGHGGGNMGDAYLEEEIQRRKFIQRFSKNRIVIFPQTIHFSDTSVGKKELEQTIAIYSQHPDLTLIAREEVSFNIMKQMFSANNVIMTPDIVLSLNLSGNENLIRKGALLCLRNDKEAMLSEVDKLSIQTSIGRYFQDIQYTDTISKSKFFFIQSKDGIVRSKLNEFRASRLIITDRLHGMVFAAITGTPCIAMANFNHKVKGTYGWISKLGYIKFCSDISELDALLDQTDLDRVYTYDPAIHDQYWDKIKHKLI